MIAILKGQITQVNSSSAVLMTSSGVGYQVFLAKKDLDQCSVSEEKTFQIYTSVKEDAIELYGFLKDSEKQLFQLLISVSGVGPKLGLVLTSTLSHDQIVSAILNKDLALLSSVSGIGKKTAERLCLELKEKASKIPLQGFENAVEQSKLVSLQQALKGLGYGKDSYEKAISQLSPEQIEESAIEELIKKSLQHLTSKS